MTMEKLRQLTQQTRRERILYSLWTSQPPQATWYLSPETFGIIDIHNMTNILISTLPTYCVSTQNTYSVPHALSHIHATSYLSVTRFSPTRTLLVPPHLTTSHHLITSLLRVIPSYLLLCQSYNLSLSPSLCDYIFFVLSFSRFSFRDQPKLLGFSLVTRQKWLRIPMLLVPG